MFIKQGRRCIKAMQEVLVIDDTEEVRSVIIKTLEHFGFEARGAKDGETGVQMALDAPPDLIVCDVRMPVLDGYQTLAKVRELPAIANTPFIFLTAAMEKDDIRRGMVLGADDYLTKPFTPEELLDAVTMRLARQAGFEERDLFARGKIAGQCHASVVPGTGGAAGKHHGAHGDDDEGIRAARPGENFRECARNQRVRAAVEPAGEKPRVIFARRFRPLQFNSYFLSPVHWQRTRNRKRGLLRR